MRPKSTTPGVIFLTRGLVARVAPEDFAAMNAHLWYAVRWHQSYYAVRGVWSDGRCRMELMHRVLTDAAPGEQVDHRDGDGLNNCRANLRIASHAQNQHNRGPLRTNASGYKGVHFRLDNHNWRAVIIANRRTYRLGVFATAEEAAHAYDAAALKLHGPFARLNF
jgi:hypothetical protein